MTKKYTMRILQLGVIVCFLLSCNNNNKNRSKDEEQLSGVWIPKEIKWDTYDAGQPDIRVLKEKNTMVLNFDNQGQGKIIYATVSLGEDDSLALQVDMHCDEVEWKRKDAKIIEVDGIKSKDDKLSIT